MTEHAGADWGDGRDIDVLFVASRSQRRDRVLARCGAVLRRHNAHIVVPGGSAGGPDDEWELLRRARVSLIVHAGEDRGFAWHRAMKAIQAGAVVVTERSTGMAPLQAGRDVIVASTASLPWVLEHALADDTRLRAMRQHALDTIRAAPTLTLPSTEVDVTDAASDRHSAAPRVRETDSQTRALAVLRLDLVDLSRRFGRGARGARGEAISIVAATPAYQASRTPEVSIVCATFEHTDRIRATLQSAVRAVGVTTEIVIVDDGSQDDTSPALQGWMHDHPAFPAVLVRHAATRGFAAARNTGVDLARGRFCFILDAGNEVAPHGLAQLVDAFDDPDLALTYGLLECFDASGPTTLENAIPWDAGELARGNVVDAMAMVRTRAVRRAGGFTTDPQLHGWEHFDLWCSLVERGARGKLVPSIVGRRRIAPASMRAFVDLGREHALDLVRERHPDVTSPSRESIGSLSTT